jgi:phosphomethylpyrimidine synthase
MAQTQLQHAKSGKITAAMRRVAERENRKPEFVRKQVADGQAVIPNNNAHESLDPMIIGKEFSTKVNANIGNSDTTSTLQGGASEAPYSSPLRRRHGDGSLDGRRPRRDS